MGAARAADSSTVDLDTLGDVENGGGGGDGVEGANRGKAEPRGSINTRFMPRSIKQESLHQGVLLPAPPPSQPPSQHQPSQQRGSSCFQLRGAAGLAQR